MDANLEALENLQENLKEHGYDLMKIPYVLQLNKRDLPQRASRRCPDAGPGQEGRTGFRVDRLQRRRRV